METKGTSSLTSRNIGYPTHRFTHYDTSCKRPRNGPTFVMLIQNSGISPIKIMDPTWTICVIVKRWCTCTSSPAVGKICAQWCTNRWSWTHWKRSVQHFLYGPSCPVRAKLFGICGPSCPRVFTSIHFSRQSLHLILNARVTMVIKRNYRQPMYRYITVQWNLSSFQKCKVLQNLGDRSGKNDLDMTSSYTSLFIGCFLVNPCIQKV